jgi:hypothetical protein
MNDEAERDDTEDARTFRGIARKSVASIRYRYGRRFVEREDWEAAAAESLRLFLADWCTLWQICGYGSCLRAGRCRRTDAPCFDRLTDFMCRQLLRSQPFVTLHDAAVEIDEEIDDDEE